MVTHRIKASVYQMLRTEGAKPFFYKDTRGLITIGYGYLLKEHQHARLERFKQSPHVKFDCPFIEDHTHREAAMSLSFFAEHYPGGDDPEEVMEKLLNTSRPSCDECIEIAHKRIAEIPQPGNNRAESFRDALDQKLAESDVYRERYCAQSRWNEKSMVRFTKHEMIPRYYRVVRRRYNQEYRGAGSSMKPPTFSSIPEPAQAAIVRFAMGPGWGWMKSHEKLPRGQYGKLSYHIQRNNWSECAQLLRSWKGQPRAELRRQLIQQFSAA